VTSSTREVIFRADEARPPVPGKTGGVYIWQFYLRRATLNPEFSNKLGLLFWDHFASVFEQQPFQVCACLPSAVPIGMAILGAARKLGLRLNVFLARREAKDYGFGNWFEGYVLPDLLVLLVDDLAASADHMLLAASRIPLMLGLVLHRNYFAVINKVGNRANKACQHTGNYLNNELVSFYTLNNFCLTATDFHDKYGTPAAWTGIVP
jgi:orotate phosphoribosyltransferase